MSDAALYRAILADPADDTPRLALADWLDENGQPDRASFVRTQVALAEVPEHHPRWAAARRRADFFLDGTPFVGELPPLPDGLAWGRPAFRRGFPWKLAVTDPHAFARHAPAAFAVAPVEGLEVDGRFRPDLRPLLTSPHLLRITSLRFVNWPFGPDELRELADSPFARNLTRLRLEPSAASRVDEWVRAARQFTGADWFPRLELLGLHGGEARLLLGLVARDVGRVGATLLDLSDSPMAYEGLSETLASPALAGVTEVRLDRAELWPAGGWGWDRQVPLVGVGPLDALYLSDLRGVAPDRMDLTAYRHWPTVRAVGLRGWRLGGRRAAGTLARLSAALQFLDLSRNPLCDGGAGLVAGSPALAGAAELRLMGCDIGDRGGRALAASPYLDAVLNLDLTGNRIRPDSVGGRAIVERFGDRVTFG